LEWQYILNAAETLPCIKNISGVAAYAKEISEECHVEKTFLYLVANIYYGTWALPNKNTCPYQLPFLKGLSHWIEKG
jgi:hypothetical protein